MSYEQMGALQIDLFKCPQRFVDFPFPAKLDERLPVTWPLCRVGKNLQKSGL